MSVDLAPEHNALHINLKCTFLKQCCTVAYYREQSLSLNHQTCALKNCMVRRDPAAEYRRD
jgi:hypothetical protein